jgi:hypothetical protein
MSSNDHHGDRILIQTQLFKEEGSRMATSHSSEGPDGVEKNC